MSGFTRFIIPAIVALAVTTTGCQGQKKTTDIGATMKGEKASLAGKNWKLESLSGVPVVGRNAAGEAYIKFGADSNRISGNTGCNNFFGSYNLPAPGKITIKQVGSTKRACPNMDVEMNYLKALNTATNYSVSGDMLMLNDGDNKELAKFRAR
ncbi:META domain-containing protein [Polluticoccus soli]|uniref:META domain-containing protein n=1 Tax=Polluticoccus soli TaxID=3034150 RepID=UPI0023E20C55|nr:META domain-containing protein [Flavipsychrobacter sp. JY13-12]